MNQSDVDNLRELIYDIRKKIEMDNDRGIKMQCATYNDIINSKDIKLWAEDTKIGEKLLVDLEKQTMRLDDFVRLTLRFVDNMESYLDIQTKINRGKGI